MFPTVEGSPSPTIVIEFVDTEKSVDQGEELDKKKGVEETGEELDCVSVTSNDTFSSYLQQDGTTRGGCAYKRLALLRSV